MQAMSPTAVPIPRANDADYRCSTFCLGNWGRIYEGQVFERAHAGASKTELTDNSASAQAARIPSDEQLNVLDGLSDCDIPLRNFLIRIDSAIAKEWPVRSDDVQFCQVAGNDGNLFVFVMSTLEHFSVGICHK